MSNKDPNKKKSFIRPLWFLPPAVGFVLLIVLFIFQRPLSFNDQEFRTEFVQQAAALKLKIVAESSGFLAMEDLPLLTRVRLARFPVQSQLEVVSDGDGTDTFLVEDNETKMQYELDIYSKDHRVRAVALHYPKGYLKQVVPLQRRLEEHFRGLRLLLRAGYLFTPTPQLDNKKRNLN